MKKITNTIATFLYSNTVWIFGVAILMMCIVLMVDGVGEEVAGWSFYLYISMVIGLFLSPVLVFTGVKDKLRQKFNTWMFGGIWGVVFIIYPLVIWKSKVIYNFMEPHWEGAFFPTVAMALLAVEVSLLLNKFIGKKHFSIHWLRQLSLEKTILIVMIPLSLLATEMTEGMRADFASSNTFMIPFKFVYFAAQFYLMFFVYYLFYVLNHYVLINQVFKEKGLLYYVFSFVGSLVLFYPIAAQLISWLPIVQQFDVHVVAQVGVFDGTNAALPLLVMLGSIPFILSFQWLRQNNEITLLEKEKSETELSLLKQQINPHFFFNTLNSLYALSLTEDKRTPEVILQLSELMRYVIYKGKEEESKLEEELKYIEDYTELQQIRLHKKLDYRIEKNITDGQIGIPPLLFIILVENAFKHGIEPAEKDCFLHLKIDSDENGLTFSCRNSVEEQTTEKAGIGLENLRRRLKLRYPNRHELLIEHSETVYESILKITW